MNLEHNCINGVKVMEVRPLQLNTTLIDFILGVAEDIEPEGEDGGDEDVASQRQREYQIYLLNYLSV